MKKRLTALVLALAALAWSVPAGAAALEGPGRVLLSWTGDARTTVTISWQDAAGVEAGYVTYAPEGRPEEEETVQAAATPYACGISNGGSRFEATLTGLTPGTGYTYRVGGPGGWSDWAAFTTDGAAEETVFLYMGDIQVNADAGAEFAAWGELAAGALRRSPDAAFGLLGGDIVESGVRTGEWDLFLDAAGPVFSRIPLMPANGNHESNFAGSGKPELYLDTFSLPLKGPAGFEEEFYSFDCGAVHVTVLNAWVVSGEQAVTEEDWAAIGGWPPARPAGRWWSPTCPSIRSTAIPTPTLPGSAGAQSWRTAGPIWCWWATSTSTPAPIPSSRAGPTMKTALCTSWATPDRSPTARPTRAAASG